MFERNELIEKLESQIKHKRTRLIRLMKELTDSMASKAKRLESEDVWPNSLGEMQGGHDINALCGEICALRDALELANAISH